MTPSMYVVSRFSISIFTNAISFLVFSKIILGSSDIHRKQFGAITMARLLASIFVTVAFCSAAKTLKKKWDKEVISRGNNCRINK